MKTKTETIKRLLSRIGIGTKPVAMLTELKGVRIQGIKVASKPEPKAVVIPTPKPKPKPIGVIDPEAIEIMNLVNTDPLKAYHMAKTKDARAKKERLGMALSPLERDREEERIDLIKKAALTLTSNLPKTSDVSLDPNWKPEVLLKHIAEAAFRSSLDSDILWIGGGNLNGVLKVKSGAVTVDITRDDMELLNAAASKLWNWSGVLKSLDSPDTWDLRKHLSNAADHYAVSQAKLKPSSWYLSKLVENSVKAPLKYTKESSTRSEVLAALTLAVSEQAIALGFRVDTSKNVHIDCSDSRFGTTEISQKVLLPYMQSIIDGSSVAGRLKASNDPANLLTGVVNYLPL